MLYSTDVFDLDFGLNLLYYIWILSTTADTVNGITRRGKLCKLKKSNVWQLFYIKQKQSIYSYPVQYDYLNYIHDKIIFP